jgi:hypothetical protein
VNLLGDGAKPWKAVLSSDGLSDVGTPIFCLRRGKSVGTRFDMGLWQLLCIVSFVFRQATNGSENCHPSGSSNPRRGSYPRETVAGRET